MERQREEKKREEKILGKVGFANMVLGNPLSEIFPISLIIQPIELKNTANGAILESKKK